MRLGSVEPITVWSRIESYLQTRGINCEVTRLGRQTSGAPSQLELELEKPEVNPDKHPNKWIPLLRLGTSPMNGGEMTMANIGFRSRANIIYLLD